MTIVSLRQEADGNIGSDGGQGGGYAIKRVHFSLPRPVLVTSCNKGGATFENPIGQATSDFAVRAALS